MDWGKLLSDFLMGGVFISVAVLIARLLSPLAGGIIAALPLRLVITLLLGGAGDSSMAYGMIKGVIPANIGAFTFALSLSFLPERFDAKNSFLLASLVCILTMAGVYLVMFL
jgi:hypothetical protein